MNLEKSIIRIDHKVKFIVIFQSMPGPHEHWQSGLDLT
jgi:hypothetical protein